MTEQNDVPAPPSGPHRGPLLPLRHPAVTGALGLLLGLAAVGIPVLVGGNGDSAFGTTSSGPLRAPADLNGFTSFPDMERAQATNAYQRASAKRHAIEDVRSGQRLSDDYGGAVAMVRSYADRPQENFLDLRAVRSDSPKPYVPYEDPVDTGAAVPYDQLLTYGNVSCVVINTFTAAGRKPAPDSVNTSYCQRSGGGLTVQIRIHGGPLIHHPDQVAALVDKAWSDLS
ncbi:hypothetical protein [Streptomyces camelliae]|uniref:Uncharacterized protein n=1 Tax=Streptomyces camelliae TaxID=3004093 RepID=A0ABY7PGJ9_9ACTN|nr:hypothetical protein [Streptomyces sp. HUAS 2-6]WBO68674.1 hypothetical protein O1G22_40645 [Streptomyces sp. HUAS 2-6]